MLMSCLINADTGLGWTGSSTIPHNLYQDLNLKVTIVPSLIGVRHDRLFAICLTK